MSTRRWLTKLSLYEGNRTLTELSAKINLQVIDDDQDLTSGLIERKIATGTTDQAITLSDYGLAEAETLYISVKFNLNTNFAVNITKPRRLPATQVIDTNVRRVGFMLLKTSGITSLHITNASGNEATVRILATDSST